MTITLTFEAETAAALDAQIREYVEAHGGPGASGPLARVAPVDDAPDTVTNDHYRRGIKAIPEGKVAPYSVVSEVVRGDKDGSQKVAGLAANDASLETAYRVVKRDGSIAAGFRWSDGRMAGADDARSALEREGVRFDARGRVLREFLLSADELRPLYEAQRA